MSTRSSIRPPPSPSPPCTTLLLPPFFFPTQHSAHPPPSRVDFPPLVRVQMDRGRQRVDAGGTCFVEGAPYCSWATSNLRRCRLGCAVWAERPRLLVDEGRVPSPVAAGAATRLWRRRALPPPPAAAGCCGVGAGAAAAPAGGGGARPVARQPLGVGCRGFDHSSTSRRRLFQSNAELRASCAILAVLASRRSTAAVTRAISRPLRLHGTLLSASFSDLSSTSSP